MSGSPPAVDLLASAGIDAVPTDVASLLDGVALHVVTDGESDAAVFTGRTVGGPSIYLKTAPVVGVGAGAALLADERERLAWLADRLPVPEVLAWSVDDTGRAFLVTTALPGSPATADVNRGDAEALIRTLAAGLRRIHDLPVDGCPFDARLDPLLAQAEQRVAAGLVDQTDFDAPFLAYAPERLFELLLASRPDGDEDLVVVHGDFTLENVLLDRSQVVGYLDVGRSGVGDRYVDLAIAARSIAHGITPEALGPFFDAYGLALPELRKIDFYVLLDEFF